MIFETQSTQSLQRITPLNERFQEEAKASSQSCGLARGLPLHDVIVVAQPLCAVPQAPLEGLLFISTTLRPQCPLC